MSCGKPCNCLSYRDHLLSVGFAASAMPTRRAGVAATEAKETALSADLTAYRNLRRNGVQPKAIDGSATLETRATERVEVETGYIARRPKSLQRFHDEATA